MEEKKDELFDSKISFPDSDARRRFAALVGIDETKERLKKALSMLVNPDGLRTWQVKYHKEGLETLLSYVERRPPLIILAGDVGTGKTELATTIGDPVARAEGIDITLFPLSLATRGSGRVGEMTKLLSSAFDETYAAARRLKNSRSKAHGAVILLVDEADAIVQSREASQMHHEDRAGVNAFIRGVDRLGEHRSPAAVILCTNRLSSIDPAVQRRASEIFQFERPNEVQRHEVLDGPLSEAGFAAKEIGEIVSRTGATEGRGYGFTYSDLTQRLLPTLVVDAYPDSALNFRRALEILESIAPTPVFNNNHDGEHSKKAIAAER